MSRPHRPLVRTVTGLLTAMVLIVGGTVAAAPAYAAAPTVTRFSPTSGPVGTSVTITGSGFVAPAKVTFGGVAASIVKVSSSTSILTQVPPGAVTGKLVVTVAGGSVGSASSYTVTPGVRLSPTSGSPTSTSKVTVSGFSAFEAVDVYLDTTAVALASADRTGAAVATVTFPASATPGPHWVSAVGRRSGFSAQAAFDVTTAWSQTGFDGGQRNDNAYENVLNPSTVSGLDEVWRTTGPTQSIVTDGIEVAGGIAYATFRADNSVRAFDAATGAPTWSHPFAQDVTAATVGSSLLYVAEAQSVFALSAATGATRWTAALSDLSLAAPVLSGSTVYVLDDSDLSAYDATTGARRWTVALTSGIAERVAVAAGIAVVALYDGTVEAFDAATGALRWSTTDGGFPGGVTIGNGLVYVSNQAGPGITAFGVEDGSVAWSAVTSGDPDSAAFGHGSLYVGTSTGNVDAFTPATGALQWSTTLSGGPVISAPPALADGVLYVTTRTGLRALAASYGGVLWSSPESGFYYSPAISDGSVYTVTTTSRIVRYSLPGASTNGVPRPDVRTLRR